MAKKKRAPTPAAAADLHSSKAASDAADQQAAEEALRLLGELAADPPVRRLTRSALECELWLVNTLCVALEYALTYDQDEDTVVPLCVAAAISLWIGRSQFTNIKSVGRRKSVFWPRMVALGVMAVGLGLVTSRYCAELPLVRLGGMAAFMVLIDLASLYFASGSNEQITFAGAIVASVEVGVLIYGLPTLAADTSNLIYDELACQLVAVTATVHSLVMLSAVAVVERSTPYFAAEFQVTKRESVAVMASLRELYRDDGDSSATDREQTTMSKRRKRAARAKAASTTAGDVSIEPPTVPAPPRLRNPTVQLSLLLIVQAALLVTQLLLSATVVLSWECTSLLTLGSSRIAWTLLRVKKYYA